VYLKTCRTKTNRRRPGLGLSGWVGQRQLPPTLSRCRHAAQNSATRPVRDHGSDAWCRAAVD